MIRSIVGGVIAGAAGEMLLNVISYADMFVRARPTSPMPGKAAGKLADLAGIELAKPGVRAEKLEARKESAGALMGYGVAVGIGVLYAVLRRLGLRLPLPLAGLAIGGTAMAFSDSIATAVGATDPKSWGVSGWMLDVITHAAYGVATAATLDLIDPL